VTVGPNSPPAALPFRLKLTLRKRAMRSNSRGVIPNFFLKRTHSSSSNVSPAVQTRRTTVTRWTS